MELSYGELPSISLVVLGQRIVIVFVGLALAYLVRRWSLVKWMVLLCVLSFTLITAESLLFPGIFKKTIERFETSLDVVQSEVPAIVKIEADRFLISQLGADNFSRYMVFDKDLSRKVEDSPQRREFVVAYHFLPYREFVQDDVVFVTVVNEVAIKSEGVPECSLDPARCDFSLSKSLLLELAENEGVNADLAQIEIIPKTKTFSIVVSDCDAALSLEVDYVTRSVKQVVLSDVCSQ